MNKTLTRYMGAVGAGLGASLLVMAMVSAATTISTNISTDGTLSVTGASTLTGLTSMVQASSRRFSVHDTAYFGGSATSTFNSAGDLLVMGSTTLQHFSGRNATTTNIFSTTASSTNLFSTSLTTGAATLGTIAVGAATLSSTLAVTGATTLTGAATMASTTATSFKVGQIGTQNSVIVNGYCTLAAVDPSAATTTYSNCTLATGLGTIDTTYRVFVQATSSMPSAVLIEAATTTAGGLVSVRFFGTNGASTIAEGVSLNFWAVK